jgi:predicted AlkP superfamily pyrophosphatase or phosphodiesterase
MKGIDKLALIVIDQLRADYKQYLLNCSELLPYSAICDCNSIPASTEAMHANIATGLYPKGHGFISKNTIRGKTGLGEIIENFITGKFGNIGTIATRHNCELYCLGGKPETIQVMSLPRNCALLGYKPSSPESELGRSTKIIERVRPVLEKIGKDKFCYSFELLDLFGDLRSQVEQQRRLMFVLTLPSLDAVGHTYGPHSKEVVNHLGKLDSRIASIIKSASDTIFIVTGDHGCRKTDKLLIETRQDNPRIINMSEIYHQFTNWWTKSKSFLVGGIFLSMLKIRQGVSEANMPPVY